ncbi:unnamed protein product [Amoebophrya sp. A25]|nr:unnamed protein product [Amoebophrya sp. A25]|eukprot:GSA25T00007157001.1
MKSLVAAGALVVATSGLRMRSRQDFGFGDGDSFPGVCKVNTIPDAQKAYLNQMHTAFQHEGVRNQLSTVFKEPLECWYGYMRSSGCGDIAPLNTGTKARRAFQEQCKDPAVAFNKMFTSMPKKLQMYLIKNFLNQKDAEGEPVPGSYNEVMALLYKMGGKEVLCQTVELIDDGCQDVGGFKEY